MADSPSSSSSSARPILAVLAVVVILGGLGGAIWHAQRKARLEEEATERAEREQTAASRRFLFGDAADNPAIQWRETGLGLRQLKPGTGDQLPRTGDKVRVRYVGRLKDGSVFDQSKPEGIVFPVGGLVPGMNAALLTMTPGMALEVFIPPTLGYGKRAIGPIPANSGLIFEVERLPDTP